MWIIVCFIGLYCRLAAQMQFRFPQFVPTPLSQLIPNASPEGVALMQVSAAITHNALQKCICVLI